MTTRVDRRDGERTAPFYPARRGTGPTASWSYLRARGSTYQVLRGKRPGRGALYPVEMAICTATGYLAIKGAPAYRGWIGSMDIACPRDCSQSARARSLCRLQRRMAMMKYAVITVSVVAIRMEAKSESPSPRDDP